VDRFQPYSMIPSYSRSKSVVEHSVVSFVSPAISFSSRGVPARCGVVPLGGTHDASCHHGFEPNMTFPVPHMHYCRDPGVIDHVAIKSLWNLAKSKQNNQAVASWCAGCSSGEEVYTLKLLWHQVLQVRGGFGQMHTHLCNSSVGHDHDLFAGGCCNVTPIQGCVMKKGENFGLLTEHVRGRFISQT
jgi:hypothetical protein